MVYYYFGDKGKKKSEKLFNSLHFFLSFSYFIVNFEYRSKIDFITEISKYIWFFSQFTLSLQHGTD